MCIFNWQQKGYPKSEIMSTIQKKGDLYPKYFPFLWLYACGAMTAMTCAYQAYDRLPIGDAVGKLTSVFNIDV